MGTRGYGGGYERSPVSRSIYLTPFNTEGKFPMAMITTSPDRMVGDADTNKSYRVEDEHVMRFIRALLETEVIGTVHVRLDNITGPLAA